MVKQLWAYPSTPGNLDITWETSEQTNVGFDARFLGSRLSATFDFYIKTNEDWLVVAPILATARNGCTFINGVKREKYRCWAFSQLNDVIGNGISPYSVGVNGSYNKNKVGAISTKMVLSIYETNQAI